MKKLNKYHRLIIVSVLAFSIFYLRACTSDTKKSSHYMVTYPLTVINNEIRFGDEFLYRFIPIDGGEMDFTYVQNGIIRDNDTKYEKDYKFYYTKHLDIPDFFIGETPVTIRLWNLVMENDIISGLDNLMNSPVYVESKTINDWEKFLTKLNDKTGREFELPTSYEWEYAARGGQKSKNYKYAGSDSIEEVANYVKNNIFGAIGKTRKPNELGLYDMSGGVWEVTKTKVYEIDPWLKDTPDNIYHVARGGNYESTDSLCETSLKTLVFVPYSGARLVLKH